MTRINLVDPGELTDQHLMAEYREIKMVPASLRRSLIAKRGVVSNVLRTIPAEYTLNAGHVTFFYDKMMYLGKRHDELFIELIHRGFKVDTQAYIANMELFTKWDWRFCNDYIPTPQAFEIVRQRIREKLELKPQWYRYHGVPVTDPRCTYKEL